MSFFDVDTHLRCPHGDWSIDLATMPARAIIGWDGEITIDPIADRAHAALAAHTAAVHS